FIRTLCLDSPKAFDWSTLHFVEPIDDISVCSACRAVSRKTAFLACRHVLCEPCYGHWKSRGGHVCFLDGDLCPENEVHWMEFKVEKMMKNQVSCWNRENGCEIVTDVSSMTDHFRRSCEHHSTCCPKCSSMVLRKEIIAHLESHCASHVLRTNSRTPPSEGASNDLEGIREGVRDLESAFGNASLNDASQVTSLRGLTAKGEEYVDSLSNMAVEVAQISQVAKQTLSAAQRSRGIKVNQIADLNTCKESFCAELDEIERAAHELGLCETSDQQEMREREEYAEKFQALKAEMQSVSRILGELTSKIQLEAAVAQSAAADGLCCDTSDNSSTHGLAGVLPLKATARVFKNELKVLIKVVWCVHDWSVLRHNIAANKFVFAETCIPVDRRYAVLLRIQNLFEDNQEFKVSVLVLRAKDEPVGASPIGASPKKATFCCLNRAKSVAKHEIYIDDDKRWPLKQAVPVQSLVAMPPEIHSHVVFGFSENLDWTTLHFVKPIDDIRVCSACRAVTRKTAFLACRHVLCECCYENWRSRGSHVCILDGELCPENEVHWMEFPAEKMMKSEVSCWNRDNGCVVITDVSSIADHLHRDCAYHSTRCPQCSSTVLRKDVLAHIESQCANHVLRIRSTTPPSEGELNDLKGIREGVRGVESAFQNASHNDASLLTSLQRLTAKDEKNVDSLSNVAVEVAQMSLDDADIECGGK
ncbi:hypothetical protein MTO96_043987, partial [Rhipicephalus appendiculatus]